MTIEQLFEICKEQIKKGNGNKRIYISDDDEGNGYHQLYYGFTDNKEDIEEIREYVCGSISDKELSKIVILG